MDSRIVTLMDNNCIEGLKTEHGFSIYIEVDGLKILFDTGQTGAFIDNASDMGIELRDLDYVILSHGHYDHSGGLEKLIEKCGNKWKLIVGDGFFREKYKLGESGDYRYIGNPFNKELLSDRGVEVIKVKDGSMKLSENVTLFRDFDSMQDYETLNSRFVTEIDGEYRVDDFADEIAIGIKTGNGVFIVTGCSHPGFVNIVETVKRRTGEKICGVLGGTHLVSAGEEWLENVLVYLENSEIETIAATHCTGEIAEAEMVKRLGNRFKENMAGKTWNI